MIFEFRIFSLAFFVAAVLTFVMAVVSWRRRAVPGALPFAIMQVAISEWIVTRALALSAVVFADQVFWSKMMFFGSLSTGVMWFSFALEYTGATRWRRNPGFILLYIIPVITFILIWTNQWHGYFWSEIKEAPAGSPLDIIWGQGFWFWVIGVYQYMMILGGITVLWIFTLRNHSISRKQMAALMLSLFMLLVSNGLHLLNMQPFFEIDLKPFFFTLSALIQSAIIFYFGFLDLIPAARGTLIENMPAGVLVLNSRDCIIEMNPASQQILSLDKKKAQGKKLAEACPQLGEVINWPDNGQRTEMVIEGASSPRNLDITINALKNKQGIVAGHLLLLRDVTERVMTQKKLGVLYDEEKHLRGTLQVEMEKRSKYSRAIVHELKTPLTAILSSSELLVQLENDRNTGALTQNIRHAALKLEQRINDLMELVSGEIGALTIYPFPVDISLLIRQSIDEVKPEALVKGVTLVSEIPVTLPRVMGDINRLKQILTQLLSNALKFTSGGKVIIRVGLYEREYLIIQIEDTGSGISQEQMEHLFDP